MRDIAAWLQELGLGKYARTFQDHEIDLEALPYIDDAKLEQIGLPIGPRVKVRAAIAALAASPTADSHAASDGTSTTGPAIPRRQPERRQVTVMFCDLVGSTRLATRLDPEDFKSVTHAFKDACRAVIERHHGHVAQALGDGILVYFGWPTAYEDSAERAVRAGLEVVAAVKSVEGPESLSAHVGISTGIVVVAESAASDPSQFEGASGITVNLAARLQTLADPDAVLISESTRRLLPSWFDLEEKILDPSELKGFEEQPPRVFRVERVREDSSRFMSSHAKTLTPLVGRRAELALLQQRWRDARDGEGQVVYIGGVPGIGKSRVAHELEQWIGGDPHFSLGFQCLHPHMHSALFPVIQQLQRLGNLTVEETGDAKLDKLETLLSSAAEQLPKAVPLVAEMMSIPCAPRYAPLALTAQQVKDQTLSVLVAFLLELSAMRPLFCLLEDAQWIDPSTQELLELLVRRVDKARILLIVTHRPEYHPPPSAHGNVSALTLSGLARRDVAEMTRRALRERAVSTEVIERIITESDAVPLFVEELARGISESGGDWEHGTGSGHTAPSASWSVPDFLRDSLMARLDRAPQGRNVAQMAAVMGREFSYDMLARVSNLSHAELTATLAHLQQSEIVNQFAGAPAPQYAFKHALVRDAAYESLLKSSRREIHAKVGAVLERERPEIVAGQPELLAYHFSLAGDVESAARYWLLGGRRARIRSANREAASLFRRALEALGSLPATADRDKTKLEIQLSLGFCSIALRGYAADETREAFERAADLGARLGEPVKEIQANFGLWGHYWMRARHDRALALGETLLVKGEALRDPVAVIVGHRALGSTLFTLGEFVRAREHLEQAIALARRTSAEGVSLSYAVDPRIAAQLMLAWELWILGFPQQALGNVLEALRLATEHADPYSIAFAHYVTSAVRLLRGEAQESLEHADRSLALSKEHRINLYALYSRFGRGCALARMGQSELAISEIRDGIEEAVRSNLEFMRGFMLGWLATVQAATGDPETGLWTIDVAIKQVNDVAGRAWEAELLRLRGDMLLAARPDAVDDAERSYRSAIEVARRQRARSLELRAATSLARLLRDRGRPDAARSELAPVYGWFTEGLDTADLRAAGALLDELK